MKHPFKLLQFIHKQVQETRRGGFHALYRKAYALIKIITSSVVLPAVIILRIIRPWIRVRFVRLGCGRIGHFATDTELFLCEREAGIHPSDVKYIFYYDSIVCNRQLRKMWDRTLGISLFSKLMGTCNSWLPGGSQHIVSLESRDVHGVLDQSPPHLNFTSEEETRGRINLQKMNMSEKRPFICFHARDPIYLKHTLPHKQWTYHDYRDSNITNYILAADELTRRGYAAIRMGSLVEKPLETDNANIIDYARYHRTDFMDIFLNAKCAFFIGSAVGLTSVPILFRKPMVFVNITPIEHIPTYSEKHIIIPKKLWYKEKRRFMTFKEIFQSGTGKYLYHREYEKDGIEVIENSPEEIRDVTIEMVERLNGKWQSTDEDRELQRKFWESFPKNDFNGILKSIIGTEFLKNNKELLE